MERRIDEWISAHQEELVADISRLVTYPSVSRRQEGPYPYGEGCAQALSAMLEMAGRYGFKTQNVEERCGVVLWENGGKTIGLWGHLDVVPEGNEWSYPPYQCTRIGDFLIGRGVQDNKGPCVAALYAMRCLRDLGVPLQNSLCQIVGCAEETGMDDAQYYVEHENVPDFNIITDCGFPVCYGEKGILEVRLKSKKPFSEAVARLHGGLVSNMVPDAAEIQLSRMPAGPFSETAVWEPAGQGARLCGKGVSAHAAFPEGGVNAIEAVCSAVLDAGVLSDSDWDIVDSIRKICAVSDGSCLGSDCRDEVSGALTCVAGKVRTEQGHAVLDLNIRYPIFVPAEGLINALTDAAGQLGFQVMSCHDSKPNYFDKESPYVKSLVNTYNRVTGEQAEPFVMGGGTYARKIPNAVAYGPGLPVDGSSLKLPEGHGNCHCPDEAQSIPNLLKALKIYILALIDLDKVMGKEASEEGSRNR